jgi:hypothetical protein
LKLRASFLETGKATIPHINNNLHSEPKDICAKDSFLFLYECFFGR